eukprot:TRINITY_DN17728_c0_g1_i1.p1 TRINITY_DN17728_c0_g1~~TRINITY_DN17728_c0_g1_i1.p1  ORF type:complete len:538 (+),score=158.52 TRINITY_DN17728_c0_g1_i1:32-1615(+)
MGYQSNQFSEDAWVEFVSDLLDFLDDALVDQNVQLTQRALETIQRLVEVGQLTPRSGNYLSELAVEGHEVLLAAQAEWEAMHDLVEYMDTLQRLVRQQNIVHPHTPLFQLLEGLLASGHITTENHLVLEQLVIEEHPALLAAFSLYQESGQTSSAWAHFWDTITHFLKQYSHDSTHTYIHRLESYIDSLSSDESINMTEAEYLKKLLYSPQGDVILESAFSLYQENSDSEELKDTLVRLSQRWQRESKHQKLLLLIQSLLKKNAISPVLARCLQHLVYLEDVTLLAAFSEYLQNRGRSALAWPEFWDTVSHVVWKYIRVDVGTDLANFYQAIVSSVQQFNISETCESYLRYCIDTEDAVLEAAFLTFLENSNAVEFTDTLQRLSTRWRRVDTGYQDLLEFIRSLASDGHLSSEQLEYLEGLVFFQHPLLLEAFANFESACCDGAPLQAAEGFWNEIQHILANRSSLVMYDPERVVFAGSCCNELLPFLAWEFHTQNCAENKNRRRLVRQAAPLISAAQARRHRRLRM